MKIDTKLFKKNLKFFKKEKPSIYELIKDINPSFLKINVDFNKNITIKAPSEEYIENYFEKYKNANMVNIKFGEFENQSTKSELIHFKFLGSLNKFLQEEGFNRKIFLNKVYESKIFPFIFINQIKIGSIANLDKTLEGITSKKILIYEKSVYKFMATFYFIDWQEIYENYEIFLALGENKDLLKKGISYNLKDKLRFIPLFFLHIYDEVNNEFLSLLRETISLSFKGWGYYDDEKEGLIHIHENIKEKYPYIKTVLPKKKKSTAIIVGAGPSLDFGTELIKELKDKGVIFSCGTAIHKLYNENIIPDFQIELERNKDRVKYFDNLPEKYTKKITLIAADIVPSILIKKYKNVYLFPRTASISQKLLNPKIYPIGISPTVVNTATSLAIYLGFENIIFIGVDMGYKNIEKKHASDTIYDDKNIERKSVKYYEVEGNTQKIVYTDDILLWAKDELESLIFNFKDRNFFNLSDGAKIKRSTYIPISEFNKFKEKLTGFDKARYLSIIHNNTTNNYKDLFNPTNLEEKTVNDFFDSFKEKIKNLKNKTLIEKIEIIEDIILMLEKENKVITSLYGGTLRQSLVQLIYAVYFFSTKEFNNFVDKYMVSINIFKEDFTNIKNLLNLKIT